jgi:hypothetical protein
MIRTIMFCYGNMILRLSNQLLKIILQAYATLNFHNTLKNLLPQTPEMHLYISDEAIRQKRSTQDNTDVFYDLEYMIMCHDPMQLDKTEASRT